MVSVSALFFSALCLIRLRTIRKNVTLETKACLLCKNTLFQLLNSLLVLLACRKRETCCFLTQSSSQNGSFLTSCSSLSHLSRGHFRQLLTEWRGAKRSYEARERPNGRSNAALFSSLFFTLLARTPLSHLLSPLSSLSSPSLHHLITCWRSSSGSTNHRHLLGIYLPPVNALVAIVLAKSISPNRWLLNIP